MIAGRDIALKKGSSPTAKDFKRKSLRKQLEIKEEKTATIKAD